MNSPPTSPTEENENIPDRCGAQERGRKKIRRDRAEAYRNIKKLEKTLQKTQAKSERYKKRCNRLKTKINKNSTSPRTLNKNLLQGQKISKGVRRTLLFHTTLIRGIRDARKTVKNINQIFNHQVLRKYKLLGHTTRSTGITYKAIRNDRKRRDQPAVRYIQNGKQKVYEFLVRDDNSRIKAGKKETITRKKVKKQKRLLTDTMKYLHLKFLAESQVKILYSLFCKLRPFWVISPKESDCDTCLCKTHKNLQYKAEKLYQLKVLKTSDLNHLVQQITCSGQSKECMYQECKTCSTNHLETNDYNPGQQTSWSVWVNRREERESFTGDISTTYSVQVTRKIDDFGTVKSLLEMFENDLKKGCHHLYNIGHQYRVLRHLREALQNNEIILHIDFSENFNCKYGKENQSVHFGASHSQATLHTGMFYASQHKFPFCSISDCNKHDLAAIWAHLVPVLKDVRMKQPDVDTVHFISDGPTTQYRNKNFYSFSMRLYDLGFKGGSWNFLEAGHGKGAADGVGAAIKRTADGIVKKGADIPDANILYQQLQMSDTGVQLFFVTTEDIKREEALLKDDLQVIKGAMLLHQLITEKHGEVFYRNVGCFFEKSSRCNCYAVFSAQFQVNDEVEVNATHESDGLTCVKEITEDLKGRWCVVEYNREPYPGIIQDVRGGEAGVKVMHKIGNNRFFWPSIIDDILWYEQEHVISLIPPPMLVTKRHHQIEKEKWTSILKYLDDKY